MDSTIQLILLSILLIMSGIFSASETALMSLTKIKLRKMEEDNVKGVEILIRIMEDPSKVLSTILIANNIVNIGATSIATAFFMDLMSGTTGVALATFAMTVLVLIFGEITPKSISANNPEKVALFVSRLISFMMCILSPIVLILNGTRKIIFKILRIEELDNQPLITEEDLKTYVNVSHEEGVIEMEEKEIIHNVFAFGDLQAKQAMVNRVDIVSVDKEISYKDLVEIFEEEKFTRIPVYEDSVDSIIGIVNIKDIAFLDKDKKESFNILDYMRKPFFTYEFKNVAELLEEMKIEKVQMAIVLDEYGGTAGLLTIENLLEEIVGDIGDEFDKEEFEILKINDNEYKVKGYTSLIEVNSQIGLSLESEDVDSLAGYVIEKLKGFPEQGDEIELENVKFIMEEVEKNKINTIRISRIG